jgi:hypothetical protein
MFYFDQKPHHLGLIFYWLTSAHCFQYLVQVKVLKLTVEDLEKERDFYFGKLRNIELICQENEGENDPVLQRIVDILYATDVRVYILSRENFFLY